MKQYLQIICLLKNAGDIVSKLKNQLHIFSQIQTKVDAYQRSKITKHQLKDSFFGILSPNASFISESSSSLLNFGDTEDLSIIQKPDAKPKKSTTQGISLPAITNSQFSKLPAQGPSKKQKNELEKSNIYEKGNELMGKDDYQPNVLNKTFNHFGNSNMVLDMINQTPTPKKNSKCALKLQEAVSKDKSEMKSPLLNNFLNLTAQTPNLKRPSSSYKDRINSIPGVATTFGDQNEKSNISDKTLQNTPKPTKLLSTMSTETSWISEEKTNLRPSTPNKKKVLSSKPILPSIQSDASPSDQSQNEKTLQIENPLIRKTLFLDLKQLVPKQLSFRLFESTLTLCGKDDLILETIQKIEQYIAQKVQQIYSIKIEDLPKSAFKIFEEDPTFISKLENQYQVITKFFKHSSLKMTQIVGLEDKEKRSLVLIDGPITKIQADAIVNNTNLKFAIGAAAQEIYEKAGREYEKECASQPELLEGEIYISGSGTFSNCKKIINLCAPLCSKDSEIPQKQTVLQKCIENIFQEAKKHALASIAIPFLVDDKSQYAYSAVITMIEELSKHLFTNKSTITTILLCCQEKEKLKIAEKKIRLIASGEEEYKLQYQWQWRGDGGWQNYDPEQNSKIDLANYSKLDSVLIYFPITKQPASHKFNLNNQTMQRIATWNVEKLEKRADGWFSGGMKFKSEVSQMIDLKLNQGCYEFELFLNEYLILFKDQVQINTQTGFRRGIRNISLANQETQKDLTINKVNLKSSDSFTQNSGYILIEGFVPENVKCNRDAMLKHLEQFIESKTIKLSGSFTDEQLMEIATQISKYKLVLQGVLKAGTQIIIKGVKKDVKKIEKLVEGFVNNQKGTIQMPSHWTKQTESTLVVPLYSNSEEWKYVEEKFAGSMDPKRIKSIKRIQNPKFWEHYICEKHALQKRHEEAGLSTQLTEMHLWHGTRSTDPATIYAGSEECFDMNYANTGMWGRAIYFAVDASYSNAYCHRTNAGTYLLLFARVLVGDSVELYSNSMIVAPPFRQDTTASILYDSVKGKAGGQEIYMLYRMRRAYPEYVVEYV